MKSGGNDSHAIVLEQAFGPFDLLRGLAWVFGGYLGATILGLVVGPPRVFKKELVRLSALGVYAAAARLLARSSPSASCTPSRTTSSRWPASGR